MNISEAKKHIRGAVKAYFARDEFGNYKIPPETQRPVFLMGPPGIGKTAVMKQLARELGLGLVSYSMTHHTRQSALGLPVITKKNYGGREYSVTEYTMSEIVASVYETIEETGLQEGILFLDEINCVSETLTPSMLQFLQFKTFGKHKVPDGWIVVTAGNPPEYNRSVREFDIVTWDRLKRIDVEPDLPSWREYAVNKGVHPAVLTYLENRRENFYKISPDPEGTRFVTARGWDDLSDMLLIYEEQGTEVELNLVSQYIQDPEIARDFADYYELFNKYKSDYQVEGILTGSCSEDIYLRAENAPFDERLSLIGLLMDNVTGTLRSVIEQEDLISGLLEQLRLFKTGTSLETCAANVEDRLRRDDRRGTLSPSDRVYYARLLEFLRSHAGSEFPAVKADYDALLEELRAASIPAGERLERLLTFAERVWPSGQEMLIIITGLTLGWYSARFISRYSSPAYYRHNRELMFYERQTEIIRQINDLQGL